MGMNREDAYYEPDGYDDRSDEIDELTFQLMKKGAEYDPTNAAKLGEALGEMSADQLSALQDCIDGGNYEIIGRKIMMIAYDYLEHYAKLAAEREY